MLKLIEFLPRDASAPRPTRRAILTAEERRRSRLAIRLTDGTQAALYLARGTIVVPGGCLRDEEGGLIEVVAAGEALFRVTPDPASPTRDLDLLRGAYHLGNRHIPVALTTDALYLERDPVLATLLTGLGLCVEPVFEPFVPEPGAYGGGHRHDRDEIGGSVGEALSKAAHEGRHA